MRSCLLVFVLAKLMIFASVVKAEEKIAIPSTEAEAKFLQEISAAGLGLSVNISIMLDNNVRMQMVFVPAGKFYMGSPTGEAQRKFDEGPVHFVEITKPFYMGKFEITQLQYRSVIGMKKVKFRGDGLPMNNINWYDVNAFIGTISNGYGLNFRLPTEAEWEYACRAGTKTPFNTGPTISAEQACYNCKKIYANGKPGMYMKMPSPVGKYPPNAFGLHDMHGNVWEWCKDFYNPNYYKSSETIDPKGPLKGMQRVVRGGSWKNSPDRLRSARRDGKGHGADKKYLGFRVVLEISESGISRIAPIINPLNRTFEQGFQQNVPYDLGQKTIEHELVYDEQTKRGYISVTGKGLEARAWMLVKIGEICSSKNIVIEEGRKPEAGYYRLLDERLENGVFTIEFEAIR